MSAIATPDRTGAAPLAESLVERRLVLPGGVFDAAGRVHRVVQVRELTGADEERLFDRALGAGSRRVSAFLARAIAGIDGLDAPIDEAFVDALQIGDRDYLLLRLRQMDLGDAVHQVMRCPSCRAKVDIDFNISELPVRRLESPAAVTTVDSPATASTAAARLRLRWPSGADQAAVESLALTNPAAANTRLFTRLVQDIDGRGAPDEAAVRAWPIGLRTRLSAWLAANTPGPDLYLDLDCPHCRTDMSYAFDLPAFFLSNA